VRAPRRKAFHVSGHRGRAVGNELERTVVAPEEMGGEALEGRWIAPRERGRAARRERQVEIAGESGAPAATSASSRRGRGFEVVRPQSVQTTTGAA
jgi:hypothetical protein